MVDYSEVALVRGMSFLAESQAAIANNLANVDSTGYKRRISVAAAAPDDFHSTLDSAMGTIAYREVTDWSPGAIRSTGSPLDIALDGPGYFRVKSGDGHTYYTRNGSLAIDHQGRLSNSAGDLYLSPTGDPIALKADGHAVGQVRFNANGEVTIDGTTHGRLGIFKVSPDKLRPAGRGRYSAPADNRPVADPRTELRQSNLERSNVQALNELVQMIAVQRGFDATSRALATLGRVKSAFVNVMGR